MSSANSFLSSTTYHGSNTRYASSQTPSTSASSSFNILSNSVQQQLNDLNSTRSSTSSCSTSHCLSNQCLECTTILSTRPSQSRCNLNSYLDSSANSSHFVQNCSCISNSTLDNHSQISIIDDQQSTRILSMNIPVDNSNNNLNGNPINSSSLNIEIEEEEDDDDDQRIHLLNDYSDQNEQLEVFVGFYRPGEYQRETIDDDDDDDDDDGSETSHKSDAQKKEEQSTRELISDDDEGNEDQDFIDEDLCPNQDEDTDQQQPDGETLHEEQLNPNILNNVHPAFEHNQQNAYPMAAVVQIDEDEDQGFGAQFNDDCQSSDDENNHLSTISLNNNNDDNEIELINEKKKGLKRSQSDSALFKCKYYSFISLPSLNINSQNHFEKIEHIIIDDQQPTTTTMSNFTIKKKQDDNNEYLTLRKKKILRKSTEEIIVILNEESLEPNVDEAVRAVERHVMLWSDEHARQIDNQSSVQLIVQYFQLNIDIQRDQQSRVSSIRKELLLDYLQYRSEADISANDLHESLLQYPEFSSQIHSRFFPFWPPRDVDLLQWLSHWIKQGALPVAIMNMDHHSQCQRVNFYSTPLSWQHRIIYGVEPRGIYLMNPIQIQSPQQVYEQLTVDSITYITRQEIVQRYNQSPMCLTPLAINNNKSRLFSDTRWRTMNVLGQVVNALREDRQLSENETRNIPYRPTVTHVRIPSTCSSGILIFSKDYNQLINASDLPLRQ